MNVGMLSEDENENGPSYKETAKHRLTAMAGNDGVSFENTHERKCDDSDKQPHTLLNEIDPCLQRQEVNKLKFSIFNILGIGRTNDTGMCVHLCM